MKNIILQLIEKDINFAKNIISKFVVEEND